MHLVTDIHTAQSTPPSGGYGGTSANATSTPPILPTPPPGAVATAELDPPPAPGSFSASVTGRTSVSLSWQVQSGIEAHHLAHRVNNSAQPWLRVNLGKKIGSHSLSGLTCGTSYQFAVKARGDGTTYKRVWGAYARTTATTNSCPAPAPQLPLPPAPGDFSASASGTDVRLTWKTRSGISGYYITHKVKDSGPQYTELGRPGGTATSFDVSEGLECGKTYRFAIKGHGDGQTYRQVWSSYSYVDADTCPTTTPNPTATATPSSPTWKDCKTVSLGSLGIDRTAEREGVYPTEECRAPSNDPSGGTLYAHYYSFSLTETAHVTIDLTSSTADTNLGVFDLQGTNSSNDDNDENPPGSSNTNSRVSRKLEGGRVYFIRASLIGTPPPIREFLLSMKTEFWIPAWGHQPDHTVQYSIGPMPPTPSPPEPVDQSANGYAPGYVIPEAIATAVVAWNNAVSASWPNVLFCERTPVKELHIDSAKPCPTRDHDDGKTITISFTRDDCEFDKRIACSDRFTGHPGNLKLDIVHPAQWFDEDRLVLVHIQYTLDPNKHRRRIDEDVTDMKAVDLIYLPSTVMHELGHAAGLEDLYLNRYMADWDRYRGSIMWEAEDAHTAIPDFDKNYIKQVYRNEHGARPHR